MSHESLTSNPVDIKRAIETLPGRYGFAEQEIAKYDLSKAYYLIERGGSNRIVAQFYDTHGDSIVGFVAHLLEVPVNHDCEPIVSSDDGITRYCKSLAPDAIIDDEFGRRLHDPDLVAAIIDEYGITRAEWDAKPEIEKRKDQISFIAPPFCLY